MRFLFINMQLAVAVEIPDDADSLECMQMLVDGSIELVRVSMPNGDGVDMYVNEEGLYRPDFVSNMAASVISNNNIVGPCFFAQCDEQGETVSVSENNEAIIRGFLVSSKQALMIEQVYTPERIRDELLLPMKQLEEESRDANG